MGDRVVICYVGRPDRSLDVSRVIGERTDRELRLLTTAPEDLQYVLDDGRLDAVVAGGALEGNDLQTIVDSVDESMPAVPVFDLTNEVAAIPDEVDIHHIYPGTDPADAADLMLEEIYGDVDATDAEPESEEEETAAGPVFDGMDRYLAVDEQWRVTAWDDRLTELTDVGPAAAHDEPLGEVLALADEPSVRAACERAVETGETETIEVNADDADAWYTLRIVPDEDGGFGVFFRDVSEAKEFEEELAETRERLQNTLERITDAFFALDNEEQFVLLNSRAEFVLDVDADAVVGERFWDVFPAAVSTTFYREFNEAMETQEPTTFEEYYRPLDSWFEVNAYPSEDGLSVFLRDVTEQVELQQKLEELHETTRQLIVAESDQDIAADAVDAAVDVLEFPIVVCWQYDDTREVLEPLAWSEAAAERVDSFEPLDSSSEFIWEVFETQEHRTVGFVPATTQTSHHPGQVTSELLVPVGEYGVLGAYSDERDAFQETDVELYSILGNAVASALVRARRERQLAHKNERLEEFASVVSHDLRNPLQVASARVELAKDTGDMDHLDTVADNLDRMETLIEDLLERARGNQDLDRSPVSLQAIANQAWTAVETPEASLEFAGEASFSADPNRLQQLFENLFRNAIEHGASDVTITVGTAGEGFYVADDGPGIPADQRDEIFEQGVSGSEDGTGFGLAIVTDIVEAHGWTIEAVESEAGGARFEVTNVASLADAEAA